MKDLSLLNRDLSQTIIVDNSPMSYIFHPENAIDCGSFIDDLGDIELWQVWPLLALHVFPFPSPLCRLTNRSASKLSLAPSISNSSTNDITVSGFFIGHKIVR